MVPSKQLSEEFPKALHYFIYCTWGVKNLMYRWGKELALPFILTPGVRLPLVDLVASRYSA